jgi:ATP-dependent Lon protease
MLEQKIKEVFADMVVLKDPKRSEFFSNMSLPSYMRDWLVMKFSGKDGVIDYDSVLAYKNKYIPDREAFQVIKYDLTRGDVAKFLARIRVNVNIKKRLVEFEMPDFGGSKGGAGGIVTEDVLEEWAETLLRESENWGIIQLRLGDGDDDEIFGSPMPQNNKFMSKLFGNKSGANAYDDAPKKRSYPNEVQLIDYKPFCPYKVDLNYYREARKKFTTQEWIDVLISAVDYNPKGYIDNAGNESESKKLFFLQRLLPFVEKRINLIELAPKGTGKSYIYEKISKRGWLVTGGTVSRASLIYDNAKKTGGLITRFDYIGFDESQSISFEQPNQIQSALKHYMEFGELKGFDAQLAADAGIIVLGNISAERFDTNKNMVAEINEIFQESATLDRFHGFIPGWEIPRLNQDLIAKGWAINTEYFAEVLHALRDELVYAKVVDESIIEPARADKRDLTAIKRLCTAFVKLLFPHAQTKDDIEPDEFVKYCLYPAKEMRQIIRKQLCIVDPKEYDLPGKREVPDIMYRY